MMRSLLPERDGYLYIFLCGLVLLPQLMFSQKTMEKLQSSDSIQRRYIQQMALKNPLVRQIQLKTELVPSRKINSNLFGEDFLRGDAQIIRNSFFMRIPVLNWKTNSLNSSFAVLNQNFKLQNLDNYSEQFVVDNISFSNMVFTISGNFNKRAELFNNPVMYNSGVTGVFNSSFSESVFSFTGVMFLTLSRTRTSSFSLGAALRVSSGSKIPAFLLLNYDKSFKRSGLELMVNAPYRLTLRKEIFHNSFLSFVNEMTGSLAFFNVENDYFPEKSRYGSSEITSSLLFERRIGENFVVGLNMGALYTVSAKMYEGNTFWDNSYFNENENTIDPYFSINLSMLTF